MIIQEQRPYTFTHQDIDASIGARWQSDPTTGFQFNGNIDEVRVYDRMLSQAELIELTNGNMPQTGVSTITLQDALDVNGTLMINSGTLDVGM